MRRTTIDQDGGRLGHERPGETARRGILAATVLLALSLGGCGAPSAVVPAVDGKIDVLCSFFPVYVFTKNVVGDRPGVEVALMLPAEMGCPHDYDLKPSDVRKLAAADLFVMNGGGLEEFSEAQLKKANPKVVIVDASKGVEAIELECDHDHDESASKSAAKGKHDHDHGHDHAHDHGHDHGHHHDHGVNPHFFSSPRQAARQARAIAEALAQADPAGAADYRKNAEAFAARLEKLGAEFKDRVAALPAKKIVTMHEVFDYLARDAGLEVVATIHASPGNDPSAGRMRELIETIKGKGAAAVFVEPQYSTRAGEAIAKDAGVPVHVLDPVASGPADAGRDYYEKKMRDNLAALEKALGAKKG